jgi:arylsulfatase A
LEYRNPTAHPATNPPVTLESNATILDKHLLYNVNVDPGEKFNIALDHQEVKLEIRKILAEHKASLVPVEYQLEK